VGRRPNPVPAYRKHPSRDSARCYVGGRWVSLGRYDSPESWRAYERLRAKLREATGGGESGESGPPNHAAVAAAIGHGVNGPLVSEVIVSFTRFASSHYRRASDGEPTSEVREYAAAFVHLAALFGDTPAAEFGPLGLQAVRRRMIDAGWCRNRINKQVGRIRRAFKWAAAHELVPASVPAALACVQGLQRGRTEAKESEKVGPVAWEVVRATLPKMSRHVAAMVELQAATGMRPGEVAGMTLSQIDRTGEWDGVESSWVYRPRQHKGTHRGRERVVPLGPRAREVLRRFLDGLAGGGEAGLGPDDPIFSPRVAREEGYARMRAARKTPVQPSQQGSKRRKANPKRMPGSWYSETTYAHAVAKGAERAGVGHWHPNQLRHLVASEVRKRYGLEAAQVLLGHAKMNMTEHYAEKNLALAAKVAGEMG
jgi:integrase